MTMKQKHTYKIEKKWNTLLRDGKEIQATKALFQYDVSCIPTVILELPLRKAVVKTDQALVLDEEGNVIEQ